jgi:transcriptional regulatory protein RtcR
VLSAEELASVDAFDRAQLAEVVRACRRSASLSEAGRTLFAASRQRRSSTNDADRLRKYLARFGLSFDRLSEHGGRR